MGNRPERGGRSGRQDGKPRDFEVRFLPSGKRVHVETGTTVLAAARKAGIAIESPCGGAGTCGKCRVEIGGRPVLACQHQVSADLIVTVREEDSAGAVVLEEGATSSCELDPPVPGALLAALDIGTTTMVCYLLDGRDGRLLHTASALNPQRIYGADVVARISRAREPGGAEELCRLVRDGADALLRRACAAAGRDPGEVSALAFVGNPTMQQLFLGMPVENLVRPPFERALDEVQVLPAEGLLPNLAGARVISLPSISGYVGSDTVACLLATRLDEAREPALLLDIGTNGEMVLGCEGRLVSCATAAGPALEGAGISCGMRAEPGAIDHVRIERGELHVSTVGGLPARGICGSGLVDAIACLLELGRLDARGRMSAGRGERGGDRAVLLAPDVWLTQDDIRAVQMAKGAIAAGVHLLARELGIETCDIARVNLAGAFGSFLDPASACRVGLVPRELAGRIEAVGNAAGAGCRMVVGNRAELARAQRLADSVVAVGLASEPGFQREFARQMRFDAGLAGAAPRGTGV